MTERHVILVTGTPRSGTTPVGDALAIAAGARTLYEPLNAHVGDRRVQRYFEVPGAGGFSEHTADELARDIARLRLDLRPGLFPEDHGLRRLVKRVVGSQTLSSYRKCRLDRRLRTVVWKDPFGVFLAERLAVRFGIPVLVTVRPPKAVAASFSRLGWGFDVRDLIRRLGEHDRYTPLLTVPDLGRPAHNAAVLWHVVNDHLLEVSRRVPGVRFVDMDRLVADRTGTLRELYEDLGLEWGPAVEAHLARSSRGDGPSRPTGGRAHGGRRDPAAVNSYWSDVLSADEACVVDEVNADLWDRLRLHSG